MPLSVWTLASGYNLGTFNERDTLTLQLPVDPPAGLNVEYKLISGTLPQGLKLLGPSIIGTPFEVSRTTDYRFVIRASANGEISDRTFLMTIEGSDESKWLTPEGLLPVGPNDAYYVIDSSYIDFQLSAIDTDIAAGQQLNFFIASGEGELPPGLILLPTGRITGFIQPLLAVPRTSDQGFYDTGLFDTVAYDFGYRSTNGYDSYLYDVFTYDFSIDTLKPKKLNRNYEFIVTITDGNTIAKRKFRIFVVGDDFFRADNVIMQSGNGTYTADVTYLRAPVFTTPKYLGLRRASNYQTFKIDIYEGDGNLGQVIYELATVNALIDGVARVELATDNKVGSQFLRIERSSGVPLVGQKLTFNLEFVGATTAIYQITEVDPLGGDIYRLTLDKPLENTIPRDQVVYIGDTSELPPGMQFDATTGEVFGTVPYQPAITKSYNFTIKAIRLGQGTETAVSRRVFTVDILGEIDSTMRWITDTNLGSIDIGFPSSYFVSAETTLSNSAIIYTLESGNLPPGLSLNLDGEIIGKVNQPRNQNTYRSYWSSFKEYNEKDIVKINNISQVKSVIRRKNLASVVTELDHSFNTNDIIKINSTELPFNSYSGIEVSVNKFKIINVLEKEGSSPCRIKFSIGSQQLAPLAPVFTLAKGTPVSTASGVYENVSVKSTSGNGQGARFKIQKANNGSLNPATYVGVTTITLLEPGVGYMPGDVITISGADLGGQDEINDLTFVTSTGLEFYYKINGNSNSSFNGRFFATSSTSNSLTLHFDNDPGTFGTGLISVSTGPGLYEAQTQITALNYFNYNNIGSSIGMKSASGVASGNSKFYIALQNHISDIAFEENYWREYNFPDSDRSLSTLDGSSTYFDVDSTTIDKEFKFTIKARDPLNYSAITKEFTLLVTSPNNTDYSNISARPFMKQSQRDLWRNFISDSQIFDPKYIYRLSDPNFGIQRNLKTLIYAGIETKAAVEYISAMGLNNKPKRFRLGDVKKAVAKEPGTNNVIYEVVYVDLVDPLEKGKIHLPFSIFHSPNPLNATADNNNQFYNGPDFSEDNPYWKRPIPFNSSVDRTDIIAGDSGTSVKFPSSVSIWRKRLKGILTASNERNYLPLWMRSIQANSYTELDWVPAVPLCFCKPGGADEIILNIKNSSFDFKLLDYTIDRYIIDSVEGYYEDKYLVFRNDRTTIA